MASPTRPAPDTSAAPAPAESTAAGSRSALSGPAVATSTDSTSTDSTSTDSTSTLSRRTLLGLGAAAGGLALLPAPALAGLTGTAARLDVPYVPTPQPVVDRMLALAKVGKNDVLYDLGCGDGRIVVTAARTYGARCTGIDLDPARIAEARRNAEQAGVQNRVTFRNVDLFETDLSPASVVTLYLLPSINLKLRPRLWQQLKVGARVVSHAFDMGAEWPAEKTETVDGRAIYYWTITAAQKKLVKG